MKVAIISDIHGNFPALEAVITAIEKEEIDKIFCLGDLVGYGGKPQEVIDVIREMNIPCILGNHDEAAVGLGDVSHFNQLARQAIEWTMSVLTAESIKFLKATKRTIVFGNILFTHSSPHEPKAWHYMFREYEARRAFEVLKQDICFYGHTHVPVEFTDSESGRRIINVGSVGQPRDKDPRACWGFYDMDTKDFIWMRTEYDIDTAAADIFNAGLPEYLAERLYNGI